MELYRLIVILFMFTFSISDYAGQKMNEARSTEGFALIHGTRDHRKDAEGDYWKYDFIESLSKAMPNPDNRFVVHCDFGQYMWHNDAANCVVDQLLGFIQEKNIGQMTLITHSNGANVVRFILSNPSFDRRYVELKQHVKQVIAISPSSGGTPLADEALSGGIFDTSLAWLFDYLSDAVKQQRVGDMIIYNDELLLGTGGRPSLAIPFKSIVSTDVLTSPFSSSSYCNGYLLNAGLKITKLFLAQCADGFLNCDSQVSAGDVWFYDHEKTEDNQPLNHNQSRHSCFGLDSLLKSALEKEGTI